MTTPPPRRAPISALWALLAAVAVLVAVAALVTWATNRSSGVAPSGMPTVRASPTPSVEPGASSSSTPSASDNASPTPAAESRPPRPTPTPTPDPTPTPTPEPSSFVLVGAGDIAGCTWDGDEATAALLDGIEGTIFTTGDNAYPDGRPEEFAECFGPSWGRHLDRIGFPAAGNHEWQTRNAEGYRQYFGAVAQPEGVTWYARDAGTWRVIVLESECDEVGGCGAGSPQHTWLAAELSTNPSVCTVAIWHTPRYSTGAHGNEGDVQPFWDLLVPAGVDLVLNGHDHDYQRYAPLNAAGEADANGIRQIVVGTGGAPLRDFRRDSSLVEARNDEDHGVLRLELGDGAYAWSFVPVAGRTFTDSGTGTCH